MEPSRASMPLTPLAGGPPATLHLDNDILSLRSDDDNLLLMLPREDAALHVRFEWRLPHGRTLTFVIVEGLRSYTYRANAAVVRALLDWLPLRPREALAGELRWLGVGAVALGTAMLLFPHAQSWPYAGVLVILAGCVSTLRSARNQYALNAALFLLLGLGLLFAPPFLLPEAAAYWPTGFGAALLLWGIQQASLLNPQHLLDRSQALRKAPRRILREGSRVHIVMATITLGCALPFAALAWQHRDSLTMVLSFSAMMFASLGIAVGLLLRGRHSYQELQLGGQWALVCLYFLTYGLVWHAVLFATDPTPYPLGPVYNFHLPAVSLPLIVVVVAYNLVLKRVIGVRLERGEEV